MLVYSTAQVIGAMLVYSTAQVGGAMLVYSTAQIGGAMLVQYGIKHLRTYSSAPISSVRALDS